MENVVKEFGSFGYLRAWVVPAYSDADGGGFVRPKGYEQWSVRVRIELSLKPGHTFWNEQVSFVVNPDADKYRDQHWRPNEDTTVSGKIDTKIGDYEVSVTTPRGSGTENTLLAKAVRPEHLKDARRYDAVAQTDGVSYTNITNYSYIVDATFKDNVGGLAFILNGYRDESKNEGPNGFLAAYDPGACGIKMSLRNPANAVGSPGSSYQDYWGSVEQHRPGYKYDYQYYTYWYTYWDKNIYKTRSQYRIEALMNTGALNETYSGINNEASTNNNNNIKRFMYNSDGKTRRRFIVTLLEYYIDDEEYPRLLVRVRMLKNISDVTKDTGKTEAAELREEDPFLIGPNFYLSEPAWYGGFVVQKPSTKDNKTYTFKSMPYGSAGSTFTFSWSNNVTVYDYNGSNMYPQTCTYEPKSVYYAVKNRDDKVTSDKNKLYSNFGGVFKSAVLNAREALESYRDDKGNNPSTSRYKLGSTKPDRMRWFGLSAWPDDWSGGVSLTVHELTLGPGFNKGELLAIWPSPRTARNYSV